MTEYVMEFLDRGAEGTFLHSFDAENGLAVTEDVARAKRFPDMAEAMLFWKQELPQGVQGHNPAGPNRPLSAFTVTIRKIEPTEVREPVE